MYIWTKKAEDKAKKLGLEDRTAGTEAHFGYDPVGGGIAIAWLEMGYIESSK